ncbi:hypothetical protein Taro_007717, partial [Colocasia esculenta]|nr:hypothetical protein [Colocasia esculenta]
MNGDSSLLLPLLCYIYSCVSQLFVSLGKCPTVAGSTRYTDVGWYHRTGIMRAVTEIAMASSGRRGGAPARDDEQRREERAEQQAPAPQGPVLPPPLPVDYGVFMQGLVQAMQTQAHTQAALQAQLEAQEGEMEQYLEEKKASQKRPAATFQRQDKRKTVYQTPQKQMAVSNSQ